jgi:hypothetical protein
MGVNYFKILEITAWDIGAIGRLYSFVIYLLWFMVHLSNFVRYVIECPVS